MQIYRYPYPAEILYKDRQPGIAEKSVAVIFEFTDPPLLNQSCMIIGFRGIRYPHKIAGTVTVDGSPSVKKVLAFHRGTYQLLGSTESTMPDGKWEIRGMPPTAAREIVVLALDDSGKFNAEVADFITAVGGIEQPVEQPEESSAGGG